MAGYQDLKVWQASMRLALSVYEATSGLPADERFGLTSQLRRAVVSVPSNIAEGHARNTPQEMVRFSSIALGSLAEIEPQILLSAQLGFLADGDSSGLLEDAAEVGRMLQGLIRSCRK